MFDSSFRAFVIVAAALVISPGASMAVVTEMALQRGRFAALLTVVGINIANSSLALASMLGLSAIFHQFSVGGAIYLTFLGLRALWMKKFTNGANTHEPLHAAAGLRSSAVVQGILTNWLNPSVILFYMLLLPRFISSTDPFIPRFLLLAAAHISMSMLWLSAYALVVGMISERLARPSIRRIMEILTGVVLVILGVKLLFK
jgi:threonine/homoserine/homoserine lactone efflux protein